MLITLIFKFLLYTFGGILFGSISGFIIGFIIESKCIRSKGMGFLFAPVCCTIFGTITCGIMGAFYALT